MDLDLLFAQKERERREELDRLQRQVEEERRRRRERAQREEAARREARRVREQAEVLAREALDDHVMAEVRRRAAALAQALEAEALREVEAREIEAREIEAQELAALTLEMTGEDVEALSVALSASADDLVEDREEMSGWDERDRGFVPTVWEHEEEEAWWGER